MPLTDKLRAAVFARDKGICAFSGLSLWLLDYGTAPFGQPDWPDHIVPVARGGSDRLDNLVCASFFYNVKKLSNGGDRSYLFREGRPTEDFFMNHGELSDAQAVALRRHACLTEADWYFNRVLYNIRVALWNEADRAVVTRDRAYWLRSANKRLETWRKLAGGADARSFIERGLVRFPTAPDVKLLLSLVTADRQELLRICRRLLPHFRANRGMLFRFIRAKDDRARAQVVADARRHALTTAPLLQVLKHNAMRLRGSGRTT